MRGFLEKCRKVVTHLGHPERENESALRRREVGYVARNIEPLTAAYAGQWIVIDGEDVLAANADQLAAVHNAREKREIEIPFLVYIAPSDEPAFIS